MSGVGQRSVEIHVRGTCARSCSLCDCRQSPTEPQLAARMLSGGGKRLELRGATMDGDDTVGLLHRARDEGFREVVVRTSAFEALEPGRAAQLLADGADAVLVPLFSQVAAVHDRVVGEPRSLARTLAGMRAYATAGLAVEIEIPLLPARLQNLTQVLELALRAVPTLRAAWFHVPRFSVPAVLAPPHWSEGAGLLAEGLESARRLGLRSSLSRQSGVPLCALREHPRSATAFQFSTTARRDAPRGSRHTEVCEGCAVRGQCPGVADSYFHAHGGSGLVALTNRPKDMYEQRTTPRRKWTDEQRQAARQARLLVLRPTVNCNQDCTFCSANETSNNVWSDRDDMIRKIARAGRRGVRRLSFSGGEPTLSRHLLDYVRVAKRVGIPMIELVTNGTLLDVEKRVAAFREAGLTDAFVSLHAHNEALSRMLTQKSGDFDKTVRAIDLLVAHGVRVSVNHVITRRNYRHLEGFVAFVAERWNRRVEISFAFVTPQYKALENIELVPRLSDVTPHLKLAVYKGIDLGQPLVVGSRQGVPVCFLGELRAWSDLGDLMNESSAEDAPQKQHAPACARCSFASVCPGLWKPYAARYGFDEVVPLEGPRYTHQELEWKLFIGPGRFELAPEPWRDRALEETGRQQAMLDAAAEVARDAGGRSLPVFQPRLSRPMRVVMFGSGGQASRLARALAEVPELSLEAVASPHAPERDLASFGQPMAYRQAQEAMDDLRPDAVLVAAATPAHFELALAAVKQGVPVLLEKPLTRTAEEAVALIDAARQADVLLMPAHNMLFLNGLERVFAHPDPARVVFVRRAPATSADAPLSWSRGALFETLYHALVVVHRGCGGGAATVTAAQWQGASRPERLRVSVEFPGAVGELILDFSAGSQDLSITSESATGDSVQLHRVGPHTTLTRGGRTEEVERDGNDTVRMLRAFVDAVRGRTSPQTTATDALEVMRGCWAVLDALEKAGAPLQRPHAPRHVASRDLQVQRS